MHCFSHPAIISHPLNLPSQRIEKIEYCDIYEEAGIVQKYSDKYLNYVPLTAEQRDSTQLIATDMTMLWGERGELCIKRGDGRELGCLC